MARRVYRSAQQWQSLIAQFDQSELSAESFCEQHNLGLKSFHHWRYQFSVHIKRRPKTGGFIELKPADRSAVKAPSMSLHIGDKTRLELPASMPIEQLAQLLKAVASA